MASAVEGRLLTIVEADVHRVDIVSGRCIRRLQSSSNPSPPPPTKTPHRWTTTSTNSRCSPRHPRLSDPRSGDTSLHIGRTASNVETRSSSRPEVTAAQSRRVRSCEYGDGSSTMSSVAERLRQLPRARPARAASRAKPSVVLLPPPPERPASDKVPRYNKVPRFNKVPRYNDTGSFEEVDEQLLMLEEFHVDRCGNSLPVIGPGQQTRRGPYVRTLSAGNTSSSVLENVVSAQYRKLWDLRATLEETEEDQSDEGPSESATTARQGDGPDGETTQRARERPINTAPSFLPLPSELRRQNFQHLAVERRLRQPTAAAAASTTAGLPGASVDSVEAPETDGDASDTSRYDFTTTSFESSTTTTTTTTDNNTDAGDGRVCPGDGGVCSVDGRVCPPSSMRSPRLSTHPAVQTRPDAGTHERKRPDVEGASRTLVDAAARRSSRTLVDAPVRSSSSAVRRSYSDVSDVVESHATRTEFSTATVPGVAASLRSAARKRRDFRNERMSVQRLAVDHDDVHSSTDQPSGDSVDGGGGLMSPGGTTSTTVPVTADDRPPPARCGPSHALRRFLSYQLGSHSSATRHFRCRHAGSRDYRS